MPLSPSILSYDDCRKVLDQALEADIGVSVELLNPGMAINFRQRCYRFRSLTREVAMRTFPEGDPLHSVSAYDTLIVAVSRTRRNVVEVRKRDTIVHKTTELQE